MGTMVLGQEEKNLGEGSEHSMGLCDRSMSPNVACGRGFELRVTAFGEWDWNSATVAEAHFYTRIAENPPLLDVLLSYNLESI